MIEKGYAPRAIIQWEYDLHPVLWMGEPEETCEKAFLALAYFIEEHHAEPLRLWVDADGKTQWSDCYVDENGERTKTAWGVIAELKELAARWGRALTEKPEAKKA